MTTNNQPMTPDERRALLAQLLVAIDDMGWRNLRTAERMLAPHGLTFAQAIALALLAKGEPELDMSRVAAKTGLPASTVTGIMDRLVARGLVKRHHSETDRRRITASATEAGIAILQELNASRLTSLQRLMDDFSPEEIRLLSRLIDRWTSITEVQAQS